MPEEEEVQPACVVKNEAEAGYQAVAKPTPGDDAKRKRDEGDDEKKEDDLEAKKRKAEDNVKASVEQSDGGALETESSVDFAAGDNDDSGPAPVMPSKEGTTIFRDSDVLSGRGGGTNVHPGNRNFRDLINLHRRAYLKARKNDKPAISRFIVKSIRQSNGRFLKKDEKSGLWFEIGDDAAREKTSQALRQRAPEMRKLLFDTEREEARAAAEEHLRQQRILMGMAPGSDVMGQGAIPGMAHGMNAAANPMLTNPTFLAITSSKNGAMNMPPNMQAPNGQDYSQMFSAALLGGGMNRFAPNGEFGELNTTAATTTI